MKICAVIPAAGRGTRLGIAGPKILAHLTEKETIWSILYRKLEARTHHIHLVLSTEGQKAFESAFSSAPAKVSVGIQERPLGMGDAIFSAYQIWAAYDAILIVWGDQVFVSDQTFDRTIAAMDDSDHVAVLPLTRLAHPYVEYVFTEDRLVQVRQSREGDTCAPNGLGDVGTFLLRTKDLDVAWRAYMAQHAPGLETGEINFLPFLPFLASRGWRIEPIPVSDSTEARGINTQQDLAFFQDLYAKS